MWLWRSWALSPSLALSSRRFRIPRGLCEVSSLLAQKSLPDCWSRARRPGEHQAAWAEAILGTGYQGRNRGPELRLPGSRSPSLPDHSVLCSRLPHTFLPACLPLLPSWPQVEPGQRWDQPRVLGDRGRRSEAHRLVSGGGSWARDRRVVCPLPTPSTLAQWDSHLCRRRPQHWLQLGRKPED